MPLPAGARGLPGPPFSSSSAPRNTAYKQEGFLPHLEEEEEEEEEKEEEGEDEKSRANPTTTASAPMTIPAGPHAYVTVCDHRHRRHQADGGNGAVLQRMPDRYMARMPARRAARSCGDPPRLRLRRGFLLYSLPAWCGVAAMSAAGVIAPPTHFTLSILHAVCAVRQGRRLQ